MGFLRKRDERRRGMVLVITLMAVAVLVAAVIEGHRQVRASLMSSAATRDRRQLGWVAASGVEAARALLVQDKKEGQQDSVQDIWADPTEVSLALTAFTFENATLSLTIRDLQGLIQINALVEPPAGQKFDGDQKNLLDRFLRPAVETLNPDDINLTADIINALKDWMDKNDDDAITGINGAEADYYLDLSPPYTCRNGPLEHKDEMLYVKGVTPELYHGAGGLPGVGDFITEWGGTAAKDGNVYPGKINLGTCPLPVLRALLPVESEDLAESILAYRDERDGVNFVNDVSSPGWYTNAPGCADVKIPEALVTYVSEYFEVTAVATHGELKRTVVAVLHREKDAETGQWICRVMSWRVS